MNQSEYARTLNELRCICGIGYKVDLDSYPDDYMPPTDKDITQARIRAAGNPRDEEVLRLIEGLVSIDQMKSTLQFRGLVLSRLEFVS